MEKQEPRLFYVGGKLNLYGNRKLKPFHRHIQELVYHPVWLSS